jgi:hypothetical protein
MLRYWTAGESHGPALLALVDGFPAGLTVDKAFMAANGFTVAKGATTPDVQHAATKRLMIAISATISAGSRWRSASIQAARAARLLVSSGRINIV